MTAVGEKTYSANTWIVLCGLDTHYSRNDRTSISSSHRLNVYMYVSKNVYTFVILLVPTEREREREGEERERELLKEWRNVRQ